MVRQILVQVIRLALGNDQGLLGLGAERAERLDHLPIRASRGDDRMR